MAKDDNKLKEPGAGWRNDLIESAHLKNALNRDDSREASADREWIQSLRHPPKKKPTACVFKCGRRTTRFFVAGEITIDGKLMSSELVVAICEPCEERLAIWKMKRSLATAPQLLPHLREAYTTAVEAYEQEHGPVPYQEEHHGPGAR